MLGIIEGLTEFLPLSSTAHLRLAQAIFNIDLSDGYWKMYTIVIQLGAILCLPVYFYARIKTLWSDFPRGKKGDRTPLTHPLGLAIIAFIVTAVPAFLLSKIIGEHLESLYIMGASLLVGGIIMWIVDTMKSKAEAAGPQRESGAIRTWNMDDMTLPQAVWIGACQIFSAVFPGTSRSMSTIAAGQLAGMSRSAALEFSFFLSIPTMVAATGYDLLKAVFGSEYSLGTGPINAHGWMVLAIGFILSFIVAYGAVAWFMAWVRKQGFTYFAIYRILIGIVVLGWACGAVFK
jgi:undecaprenyl-diphosphatase